ncbi:MAG: hypothetical protein QXX33_04075 [Candidatus Hadarchaeales archaeon]
MALRLSVRECEDYASLVELEHIEDIQQFVIALKKFLRRYDSGARRYEREHPGKYAFRPTEKDLDNLVRLAEENGVDVICAALVAHALVKPEKEEG